MTQFRKRPVVIDAHQFTGQDITAMTAPRWLISAVQDQRIFASVVDGKLYLNIRTLEGVMRASQGDWIIMGVAGELYPCRDDIFTQTYELA